MHNTARAREALWAIPCPPDRELWWPIIGSALAEGLSEEEVLFWCESGPNFDRAEALSTIRSLARRPDNGRRGSLYAMARDAGWREPMNGHAKPHQKAKEPRKTAGATKAPSFDFAAVWRDAEPATAAHPYIAKKRGLADRLRVYRGPLTVAGQTLDGSLLVPVHDADGDLRSWQAIPAGEGKKLNAPGATLAGGRCIVGGDPRDGEPLYLCEGIGQAWSAHQATGKSAVVCFGAGNVERVARDLNERHPKARIVIVADAGKESDAERIAGMVGGAWVAMPAGSPSNFDLNDFHQQVQSLPAVAELLTKARESEPASAADAEHRADKDGATEAADEPQNLFREITAPRFNPADVPAPIRRMAEAFSAATGFDVSGSIMAATVAAAAVIDDRYRLAVRPASDWFESARLWAVLIGTPSAGKSPTIKAATDPIKDLHTELFAKWLKANADAKENEREPKPALFTSDATTEALADLLRDNPRGVFMLTEEFASWIGGIDAYRDGAGARNRGEWLQLYDGGPHQVDRVKRGSFLVPNWGASVLAACTPAGLRDQVRKLPDDGLIHRFMPCIMAAPRELGRESARDALRDWSVLLREVFAATTSEKAMSRVRISTSAQIDFDREAGEIRRAIDAVYDLSPALASHLGKHPGMLARVALTFHLVDGRPGDAIEPDTMQMAVRFMRTVRKHAAALFLGILSTAPALEVARGVARALVADPSRPASIGRNYMTQRCRAFRQAQDVERRLAVQALEDARWLSPVAESRAYGGWGASEWAVNQRVFDLFAAEGEAHRDRRQVVRDFIAAG